MNHSLDSRLDAIFAARDRDNMQPTIAALLPLLAEHPNNARVLYEVGGAFDTAGDGEKARGYYEQALGAGLSGDALRRCYLQYGSTLRNLGEAEASLRVFADARQQFPDSPSLAAFEALSWHAAGRPERALAELLELVAGHVPAEELQRYVPALRGNAAWLREQSAAGERG